MKFWRSFIGAIALAAGMFSPPPVAAKTNVFACEPEWAALARELGGDRIEAYSATSAKQDPHHIRARPSLIAKVRRADILFCSGAALEVGWLPLLLTRGAKSVIQPGKTGHIMASDHVRVLEKTTEIDRSLGDIHPEGNPHVHLDPENILRISEEFSRRLAALVPGQAKELSIQRDAFLEGWRTKMDGWNRRAKRLAGMPVIVHHKTWSYLIQWLKLKEVASLELKPGIPPATQHLKSVLRLSRSAPVAAILVTPFDPTKPAEWLSSKTDIPILTLPFTVTRDARPGDLARLFDDTLALLEKAYAKRRNN
jgi:zinc/manganese transport system substrate-binding protein